MIYTKGMARLLPQKREFLVKNKVLKTDLGILKNFELSIGKIIEETWEEEAGPTLFTPWKFFYINEVISSEDSIILYFCMSFFM
ncbi:hypothetical protein J7L97_03415 [Candidatus Bathyarchaeota archaeon]|nr:hypothetical protein [Candidatus Bathyarchaeota archaeon]